MTITPTVGRRVWYRPLPNELSFEHDQPFDAGIVHVHSDTCVNLSVTNEHGNTLVAKHHITLAQGRPALPGECEWMPYQVQVAREAGAKVPQRATPSTTPSATLLHHTESEGGDPA